ncbi:MAG: ATP-dependent helicase [Blautia sp.]|nr:ATP-dependent helicase [Blautia sp.]
MPEEKKIVRNPSQKRAIAHLQGPMMVLAGPGSGKTSVIVERTAYMIREGGIDPGNILVVTFSNAAAREMKERFQRFIGSTSSEVTFGTFHGIFYGILKHAYGYGSENILSGEEKNAILKELANEYAPDQAQEKDFLDDIAREISQVKSDRIQLAYYHSVSCSDEVFASMARGYARILQSRRKLDFDDMLVGCYELFRRREDILSLWQKKFTYILVDEFQDINPLQYDIVRMLAAPLNNLFIVGDDDQSIYHFRGARPELMLHFPKDYPSCETVLLDVNYRCTQNILQTAMDVVRHNKKRFDKNLSTPNPEGKPVGVRFFSTPREESLQIVRDCKAMLERGEKLEDVAVLFRTNQEAESLVSTLMEYQIPFTMKEKLPNLFSHWIARNILSYLSLASGQMDRGAFLEVMNRPNRYISREAVSFASTRASGQKTQVSLDLLKAFYREKPWMAERIEQMKQHLAMLGSLAPYAAITYLRKAMGYEEYLDEYAQFRRMRPEELLDVLNRIQDSARSIPTARAWEKHIEEYTIALKEQAKRQQARTEGVALSTLHASKGLEYKKVYIINVNEESIPYKKAVLPEAMEEERRLFYVGMTRAKEELLLFLVRKQYESPRQPSRFLLEAGMNTAKGSRNHTADSGGAECQT